MWVNGKTKQKPKKEKIAQFVKKLTDKCSCHVEKYFFGLGLFSPFFFWQLVVNVEPESPCTIITDTKRKKLEQENIEKC